MTSKEIKEFLTNNSVEKLYKLFFKYFQILEKWDDKLIEGDLLNEYEIKKCGEQATGIYGKLAVVVNALESYKERIERNTEAKYYREIKKERNVKSIDPSVAKAEAKDSVNDIRDYYGDFKAYLDTSEKIQYFSQSRLKRETVVKTGKHIDFTGDVNNVPNADSTAKPVTEDGWAT